MQPFLQIDEAAASSRLGEAAVLLSWGTAKLSKKKRERDELEGRG